MLTNKSIQVNNNCCTHPAMTLDRSSFGAILCQKISPDNEFFIIEQNNLLIILNHTLIIELEILILRNKNYLQISIHIIVYIKCNGS